VYLFFLLTYKRFQHFDMDQSGDLNAEEVRQLVRAAVDTTPTPQAIDEILAEFGAPEKNKLALDYNGVKRFLQSGKFREEQDGRFFVVLSLAEAETIRRIMHIRLERDIIGLYFLVSFYKSTNKWQMEHTLPWPCAASLQRTL
jgi:hypothetical protein